MKKWIKTTTNGYVNSDKFLLISVIDYQGSYFVKEYTPNQYLERGTKYEEHTLFKGTKEQCKKYLKDLMNG